jgi:hypothetical protein
MERTVVGAAAQAATSTRRAREMICRARESITPSIKHSKEYASFGSVQKMCRESATRASPEHACFEFSSCLYTMLCALKKTANACSVTTAGQLHGRRNMPTQGRCLAARRRRGLRNKRRRGTHRQPHTTHTSRRHSHNFPNRAAHLSTRKCGNKKHCILRGTPTRHSARWREVGASS